jgi:hypothetical protein
MLKSDKQADAISAIPTIWRRDGCDDDLHCKTSITMLLNVILALTNISAAVAARKFVACSPPPRARHHILALLLPSSLFSAAYHLCENAVRQRGLPGIGVSYHVEFTFLMLDRLFAVALTLTALLQFPSAQRLIAAGAANMDILAAAAVSGVLSEIPAEFYAAVAVAGSVAALAYAGAAVPRLTSATLGSALVFCASTVEMRYVAMHGLWHIFVYQALAESLRGLWLGSRG